MRKVLTNKLTGSVCVYDEATMEAFFQSGAYPKDFVITDEEALPVVEAVEAVEPEVEDPVVVFTESEDEVNHG